MVSLCFGVSDRVGGKGTTGEGGKVSKGGEQENRYKKKDSRGPRMFFRGTQKKKEVTRVGGPKGNSHV